jgi:hypothetical protein
LFLLAGEIASAASLVAIIMIAPGESPSAPSGGFVLFIFTYSISLIILSACYIYGLVKAAQLRRWGWFIANLIGTVVGLLLFALRGPTDKAPAQE